MNVAVRYYTRSGNTKKLADAIAQAVGVEAREVTVPLEGETDLLFLGSSVYAYGVDEAVKAFIRNINVKVGKVVNFSTAALVKSTYKQVAKLLAPKGIPFAKEEFACKGSFGPLHRGKPDEKDAADAAAFAKLMVEREAKRNG